MSVRLPIHQFRPGELQVIDNDLADELLIAFVNDVVDVHVVRLVSRLRVPFEGGVGESLVEVLRQDGIAIHRHVELAEGLALYGAEGAEHVRHLQVLDAIDLQTAHEGLRPLLNLHEDREVAHLAAIVVLGARVDFYSQGIRSTGTG